MHSYRQSGGAFALWKLCLDILYELCCKIQGPCIKRCYCNLLHDEPHCMGHYLRLSTDGLPVVVSTSTSGVVLYHAVMKVSQVELQLLIHCAMAWECLGEQPTFFDL